MTHTIRISLGLGFVKICLFLLPIIFLFALGLLRYGDRHFYLFLTYEDHALEVISAVFYLIATITAIRVAKTSLAIGAIFNFAMYSLYAFAMCLIFFEEISWGQRIFGIESSKYFIENSTQQEINIHNLENVQKYLHSIYIAVGVVGGTIWMALAFGRKRGRVINKQLIPGWYLMTYFLPVALFYFCYDYLGFDQEPVNLIGRDQEPVEFLLSLGFLLFIFVAYQRQNINKEVEQKEQWVRVDWLVDH